MRAWIAVLVLLFCGGVTASGAASDKVADAEINYLIQAVGNSGCTFLRNGTEHSPKDAENHMRLKYKNGKRWIDSAEQFIERLATKSSWTGTPYYLLCKGKEPQLSSIWMTDQLAAYRASKNNPL
ncbi:MAG: DUF5329 domain-containing protein [Pseudomonadales bacterium]|nr:DUF5329 domain-containing protein [Pseudomonadales bacterium]